MALSVVQAARARGMALRARLILDCTNIRELAEAIDSETTAAAQQVDEASGPMPLLPNGRWLYEHGDPRRLAQTEAIRLPRRCAANSWTPRWQASSTATRCCAPGSTAPR